MFLLIYEQCHNFALGFTHNLFFFFWLDFVSFCLADNNEIFTLWIFLNSMYNIVCILKCRKKQANNSLVRHYVQVWKTLKRVNMLPKKRRKSYLLNKKPIGCISPLQSQIRSLAHSVKQRAVGLSKIWSWWGPLLCWLPWSDMFQYLSSSSMTTST